jgi:hypothetical protein
MGLVVLPAAGGVVGLGLWLACAAPAPPSSGPLSPGLSGPGPAAPPGEHADPPGAPAAPPWDTGGGSVGWVARAGRPLAVLLARVGVRVPGRVARDLPICGRTPGRQLAEKAAAAVAGLVLPPLLALALAAVGAGGLPGPMWAGGALLLAAAGYLAPDVGVAAEAAARRGAARHALSAVLDLTVIGLAGGAGVEQALAQAAAAGHTPTAIALRGALAEAVVRREPLWAPLQRLADALGLAELRELAASLRLAGTEGAKIRASLAAKAAALRVRLAADVEAAAQAATERMSLPVVAMFAGFLVFIAYPALSQVLTGL